MNHTHRPEGDGYAVEVSLLKLRPPVLVLSAVCFVALVALLSWLGGTTEPLAASKGAANHGANQERRVEPSALRNSATSGTARDEEKRAAAPSEASSASPSAASADAAAVPGPSPAGFAESTPQSTAPAATTPAPEVTNNAASPANTESQPAPGGAVTGNTVGGYAVQAGSFPTVSEANERVSALRAAGFEARTAAVELPRRGTWYRVYSGCFASREEAAAHDKKLRAAGAASETIIATVQD